MPLGTPYITSSMLMDAPTGVAWSIIPEPRAPEPDIIAEVTNICWRATSMVDTYCNQTLRSTINNEELQGPGAARVGVQQGTGNGILVMRRWPVTQILAIQKSPNRSFPRVWSTVPSTQYEIEFPLINALTDTVATDGPDGGSSILLAPGVIDDRCGRNAWRFLSSYVNGWPHTSLTGSASLGASTFAVDDVTGFTGASAFVYDGASTEQVAVSSVTANTPLNLPNGVGTAQAGPGTLALTSPTSFAHSTGAVVSALPANVLWATVLAAAVQALESGIDAIAVQTIPGTQTVGGHGVEELQIQYELLLEPYRRII